MAYYFVDRDDEAPYRMQANKYLPQLRELIAHWRERFTGRDGRAPARLELLQTSDGVFIEDVRSGTPKKYQLSQEEWRLLVDLQHPIAQRDIESNGNAAVLDGLVEKQLVFSERDRFMSLVISHDSKQERMTMPTRLAQAFAVYSPDFSGHEVK